MEKSDQELKKDVEAELDFDPAIRPTAIGVAVKNGMVTLTGHIETHAEKRAIEKALRRVEGVRAIALELDIRLSPQHQRTDTDIAAAIERGLKESVLVPADRIRVTVDKGWVTLEGEVDRYDEKRCAETAAHPLVGVIGVHNAITVKPRAGPIDGTR